MRSACLWIVLSAAAVAAPKVSPSFSKLPLRFEDNQGRSPENDARYVARGPGFELSLAPTENWLRWDTVKPVLIHTRLAGANPSAKMQAEEKLPGLANYFIGDSAKWHVDVPGYARVRQSQVYPGIDLVFHGDNGRLEYDFIVAPGSDPHVIKLELSGEAGLKIDEHGDLVIASDGGEIQWKHPEIYQERNGKRVAVKGRFIIAAGGAVSFALGKYDKKLPLVIDPALSYASYLGGSANDFARGIGLDAAGNVYIAGGTTSPNLPVLNAFQSLNRGAGSDFIGGDAFVARFSPAGQLVYVTYLGGVSDDAAMALAVDAAGDAYVTGFTTSPDFPTTASSAYQPQFGGLGGISFTVFGDAFVTKLAPTGNRLLYSTFLGGSKDDIGTAIAIDSTGAAYITGTTISNNFPTTSGAFQTALQGGDLEPVEPCCGGPFINSGDAFVTKLDPSGSKLIFSTLVGGSKDDLAWTIALDSSNNVYIGGFTLSSDYPTTPGAYQRVWGGAEPQTPYFVTGDGFITKLNSTGTALIYSTYFGGSGDEFITGIAVDLSGNVYFTGWSSTRILPTTPGAPQPAYSGYTTLPFNVEYLSGDAIVGKMNPAGSALVYLTYLGGLKNDGAFAIAVDPLGDAYVAGFTDSSNFPVTADALQPSLAGDGGSDPYFLLGDTFLAVVNPTGTKLLYSTYFGGDGDDVALGIALDSAGRVYVTGNTVSTNLTVTSGAAQGLFGGDHQGFPELWGDAFFAVFSGFPLSGPVVSSVTNAFGGSAIIAPNTWVAIQGSALAADSRMWMSSDFMNNEMPTTLDQASVTMNGEKAYIYYISATQINALTPPDLVPGPVQIQVTNGANTSPAFTAQAQQLSPSLFVFDGVGHVVAQHLPTSPGGSYTDVGPTTLYPGLTTPAHPGEEIVVYGNGFGATSVPVVAGSETQSGTLSGQVQAQVDGIAAQVIYAGLAGPGLYQFNINLPVQLPNGDLPIVVTYSGQSTQTTAVVTVQQ